CQEPSYDGPEGAGGTGSGTPRSERGGPFASAEGGREDGKVAGIVRDALIPSMTASPSTSVGTDVDTDATKRAQAEQAGADDERPPVAHTSPNRPPMTSRMAKVS